MSALHNCPTEASARPASDLLPARVSGCQAGAASEAASVCPEEGENGSPTGEELERVRSPVATFPEGAPSFVPELWAGESAGGAGSNATWGGMGMRRQTKGGERRGAPRRWPLPPPPPPPAG